LTAELRFQLIQERGGGRKKKKKKKKKKLENGKILGSKEKTPLCLTVKGGKIPKTSGETHF